eukprot:4359530-Amphidinium_carterae.1
MTHNGNGHVSANRFEDVAGSQAALQLAHAAAIACIWSCTAHGCSCSRCLPTNNMLRSEVGASPSVTSRRQ